MLKVRNIYNDYDYDYENLRKDYELYLKEEFEEGEDVPTFEDFTNRVEEDTLNCFIDEILAKDTFENVIFIGYVHLWNGKRNAVKYFKTTQDFINTVFSGNYNTKIYFEGKKLFIQLSHHDGTHFFEIRELSKKGEARKENIENNYEDFEEVILSKYKAWSDTYTRAFKRDLFI